MQVKAPEVAVSDLFLVMRGTNSAKYLKELFTLNDGTDVYSGDTVGWSIEKPFDVSGIVENINGLKVACFSILLNKLRYYSIII
jgi:hypothetical protein